ncbi:TA system toxin CbtA family protein [Citrobacter sp. R56]|uniref:TA system toxin CbtA family protein n=1 Tax=Citrobacter sp. R56 TaxID=1573676 RepID=UPI00193BA89B|nr:TA system toxin CbtA family protein [Citrobacter sp. R56]QRG78640.1 hypothetical protein JM656_18925 [Citrobacter sp. R56]
MQTLPVSPERAARACPSPVEVWQMLLAHLLAQHYGLALNDTPFADNRIIQAHIDAGISLCDAVNFIVEKYELVRTDRPGFSITEQSPLVTRIDILHARKTTGLLTRNHYKMVTDITGGNKPQEPKR